jgi:hypothetical protein
MGFDSSESEQRRLLRAALAKAHITTGELWLYYFGIGGSVGEYEVEAYMQGVFSLPQLQRDLLAMAANELLAGNDGPRAPYSDEIDAEDPPGPDPDPDPA